MLAIGRALSEPCIVRPQCWMIGAFNWNIIVTVEYVAQLDVGQGQVIAAQDVRAS